MQMKDLEVFMEILRRSNRPPENGMSKDDWGLITLKEFTSEIKAIAPRIDPRLLSGIGLAIEVQLDGTRTSAIKKGMLELMIWLADYCFHKTDDEYTPQE